MITHPDRSIRKRVSNYLSSNKDFRVPMTKQRGSFVIVESKSTESPAFLLMGLSEMFHAIGVRVDWNDKDNYLDIESEGSEDPNSIIKSIDNFDILN